jgi:signal transduction protein with GAF and PtsI domain
MDTPPQVTSPRDPLAELQFLHQILRLATTARTWEELLETVVDGTRDALHASVTSLYLLDRDDASLTLAATNGLDRHHIGRAVVPMGEGITGRVAATRTPMIIPDVRADERFLWVRGLDQRRYIASMLSVPLTWREQVVGVLNVQTEQLRDFTASDLAQLSAIADLLAGIVEKGRLQKEAEAQIVQLKALDQGRAGDARAADAASGCARLHGPPVGGAGAGWPLIARSVPPRHPRVLAHGHP